MKVRRVSLLGLYYNYTFIYIKCLCNTHSNKAYLDKFSYCWKISIYLPCSYICGEAKADMETEVEALKLENTQELKALSGKTRVWDLSRD